MRFADRVVLVGGGTGALGSAVARAFLSEGARVAVVARRPDVASLHGAAGGGRGHLQAIAADLSRPEEAARAVEEVLRAEGRLDAVVNAAGGWAGGAPVPEEPPDRLSLMLGLNLAPGYGLARAAAPRLVAGGGGAIVEVASAAATGPQPGQASYGASKAAALSLFRSLAEERAPARVRVNVVLPGTMDTEANRRAMPDADRSGWAAPEDVARVILFLCSEEARAVFGAAIPVRGPGRQGA